MFKLIALDMDGTLLKNDKTISSQNLNAIKAAVAKGIHVVLCTGRPLNGIKKYIDELNFSEGTHYIICLNGALVQDTNNSIICSLTLDLDDYYKIHNLSKDLNINMQVVSTNVNFTPNKNINKHTIRHCYHNNMELKVIDSCNIPENTVISKIMFVDDKDLLDEVIPKLPLWLYDNYTVVRSSENYLEILNKEASKGNAVRLLADHLKISKDHVICVGDAENDISMIKYAGLGIAMNNAFHEVKASADLIVASNEDHGVAEVFEKFLL